MAVALLRLQRCVRHTRILPCLATSEPVRPMVRSSHAASNSSAAAFSAEAAVANSPVPQHAKSKPFVNLGERYWHVQRRRWLSGDRTPRSSRHRRLKAVAVELTRFESLLRNPDRRITLPHAIPLGQMVDILVELWEDDGMFR